MTKNQKIAACIGAMLVATFGAGALAGVGAWWGNGLFALFFVAAIIGFLALVVTVVD